MDALQCFLDVCRNPLDYRTHVIPPFGTNARFLAIGPPFGSARNTWMLLVVPSHPSEIAA